MLSYFLCIILVSLIANFRIKQRSTGSCWQSNSDDTSIEVKSKCRDIFQYAEFSSLQHVKTQKYLDKDELASFLIMHETKHSPALLFTNRLTFERSPHSALCASQEGESIKLEGDAMLSDYGLGVSCLNDTSHVVYLPGKNCVENARLS